MENNEKEAKKKEIRNKLQLKYLSQEVNNLKKHVGNDVSNQLVAIAALRLCNEAIATASEKEKEQVVSSLLNIIGTISFTIGTEIMAEVDPGQWLNMMATIGAGFRNKI